MQAEQTNKAFQSQGQHHCEKHRRSLSCLLLTAAHHSYLLPCPPQIPPLTASDTVLSLVIGFSSTANPLQGPVNVPVDTYSYKRIYSLGSPSDPLLCPFFFLCLLSMQKQFSKNKWSNE